MIDVMDRIGDYEKVYEMLKEIKFDGLKSIRDKIFTLPYLEIQGEMQPAEKLTFLNVPPYIIEKVFGPYDESEFNLYDKDDYNFHEDEEEDDTDDAVQEAAATVQEKKPEEKRIKASITPDDIGPNMTETTKQMLGLMKALTDALNTYTKNNAETDKSDKKSSDVITIRFDTGEDDEEEEEDDTDDDYYYDRNYRAPVNTYDDPYLQPDIYGNYKSAGERELYGKWFRANSF